jgi:integrase
VEALRDAMTMRDHVRQASARPGQWSDELGDNGPSDYDLSFVVAHQEIEEKLGWYVAERYHTIVCSEGQPIADLAKPWLKDEEGKGAKSKSLHRKEVKELLSYLGSPVTNSGDVTRKKAAVYRSEHLRGSLGLSEATAKRYLSGLSSFWEWMISTHKMSSKWAADPRSLNVWKGLGTPESKLKHRDKTAWIPWEPDELQVILQKIQQEDLQLQVLVLRGLYTGCRIEDLCRLTLKDVVTRTEGGIPYFQIRQAKPDAGVRAVAVHFIIRPLFPSLCDRAQGASGEGWLLPTLVPGGTNQETRSTKVSDIFGKFRTRKLGVMDLRKVFHSFRMSVAMALEQAGVPETTATRILGHKVHGVSFGRNSAGLQVPQLPAALEKVSYGTRIDAQVHNMASASPSIWSTGLKLRGGIQRSPRAAKESLCEPGASAAVSAQ